MFSTWYGFNMAWDFKDLNRRTLADKVLPDKVFNIAKYQKKLLIAALKMKIFLIKN